MTENKRFTVDYDITVGNYCLHDECKSKGVDGYIAYLSDEERANNLCYLLNEQDERIETLKEDVETILDYVLNKGKFAMSVKEQKAHNRLRGFVRGDVE